MKFWHNWERFGNYVFDVNCDFFKLFKQIKTAPC